MNVVQLSIIMVVIPCAQLVALPWQNKVFTLLYSLNKLCIKKGTEEVALIDSPSVWSIVCCIPNRREMKITPTLVIEMLNTIVSCYLLL